MVFFPGDLEGGKILKNDEKWNSIRNSFVPEGMCFSSQRPSPCRRAFAQVLQHLSRALKRDREIVMRAVSRHGLALQYASRRLRPENTKGGGGWICWGKGGGVKTDKNKEHKPKLSGQDILWWGGGLRVKGWGPKSLVCPSKTMANKLFGKRFCFSIRIAPPSFDSAQLEG